MSTPTPREVLFAALQRRGFRDYAINIHQPRTEAAAALLRFLRRDLSSAVVDSPASLKTWVKYGPRMPAHVRAAAPQVWASYADWRRSRQSNEAAEKKKTGHEGRPSEVQLA